MTYSHNTSFHNLTEEQKTLIDRLRGEVGGHRMDAWYALKGNGWNYNEALAYLKDLLKHSWTRRD